MDITTDGYDADMTSSTDDGRGERAENPEQDDAASAERETPDVGLIRDDELPEDLRPTEDNPLAQDPDDAAPAGTAEGRPGTDEPQTDESGAPA